MTFENNKINESIADTTEAEDEENQVKDLSIPFPFPKAADHALNHVCEIFYLTIPAIL